MGIFFISQINLLTKETSRPKRNLTGMKKCNNCPICPFVKPGKTAKSTANNCCVDINTNVNCKTKNCIYLVECKKCKEQYIGQTERTIQERFSEHRGYVTNHHISKATGFHFNQKGHSESDMEVSIVEKVYSTNDQFREQREKMFINLFCPQASEASWGATKEIP